MSHVPSSAILSDCLCQQQILTVASMVERTNDDGVPHACMQSQADTCVMQSLCASSRP